jgi:hypothetical protein
MWEKQMRFPVSEHFNLTVRKVRDILQALVVNVFRRSEICGVTLLRLLKYIPKLYPDHVKHRRAFFRTLSQMHDASGDGKEVCRDSAETNVDTTRRSVKLL